LPSQTQFPKNFFWGSATSSYQVEGGITGCDWYRWESGHIKNNDQAGKACDHYTRFKDDFKLIKSLGQNMHRVSIEWSRVEPEPGQWDEEALKHYIDVIHSLKANGIEPMVTLHHFTTPSWLEKDGTWQSSEIIPAFERYARKVAERLVGEVTYWVTLNEPVLVCFKGYVEGEWPPGKSNFGAGLKVLRNMLEAHGRAYQALHEEAEKSSKQIQVGIAKHMRSFDAARPGNRLDQWVCKVQGFLLNHLFFRVIQTGVLPPPLGLYKKVPHLKDTQDFIGLNYYSRGVNRFCLRSPGALFGREVSPENVPKNSLGWEVYPEGIYRVLKELVQYSKPIIITENGMATNKDEERVQYIKDHLIQVRRAIGEGVDVRGYLYWSLMDNFEWLEGFEPRFGLVEIDYGTFERLPRPSAGVYKKICETNGEVIDGL
jgi:beta-glucosidase